MQFPRRTKRCSRLPPASAPTSLPLPAAAERWRWAPQVQEAKPPRHPSSTGINVVLERSATHPRRTTGAPCARAFPPSAAAREQPVCPGPRWRGKRRSSHAASGHHRGTRRRSSLGCWGGVSAPSGHGWRQAPRPRRTCGTVGTLHAQACGGMCAEGCEGFPSVAPALRLLPLSQRQPSGV